MKALESHLKSPGTSQAAFARRVGVSQPTISDIIRGKHCPSVKLLQRISKETRLSVDKLLSGVSA
jgi:transcriptional regulator with XRE-family HTH domain